MPRGNATAQKYSHHRRGLVRITAYKTQVRIAATMTVTNSPFVQSQNHEPQP